MRVTVVRTGQVFNKHHCKSGTLNYQKVNPKFSIVVKKYKYTCGKCDYTYCRFFVRCTFAIASQLRSFFLLLHPYAQHCIPSLPISFSFSNLYLVCFRELSTLAENVPEKKRKFLLLVRFLHSDLNFNSGSLRGSYSQFPSLNFHQILFS